MTDKKLTQLSTGSAIVDADLFYCAPNAGGQVKQPASALRTYLLGGSGIRTLLTAALDLYISPSGNDTTGTGLSIGSPWQTINKAYQYIENTLDMGGWNIFINMATGTYTSADLVGPIVGQSGAIFLKTAGPVTISDNAGALLYVQGAFLALNPIGGDFTFTQTGAAQTALWSDAGGFILLLGGGYNFTASATDTDHMYANNGGIIQRNGGGTITGNFNSHFRAANNGNIFQVAGQSIAFSGSVTAGTAFVLAEYGGNIQVLATTFTGSLTGQKYNATMGGSFDSFGQTLPGSVAGSTGSGTATGFFR